MINKIKATVGEALSNFPLIKSFIRIFLDRRYLYHNLQGIFTTHTSREFLKKVELMFYKERVNIYKNNKTLSLRGLDKLLDDGVIEKPIRIEEEVKEQIKYFLEHKLCHDPEEINSSYFKIRDVNPKIKKAYYMCEDVAKAPHVMEIANNPILLSYVSEYFGALPSIDYIGAWWSLPSEVPSLTQSYHRDIDTLHSLKFFIYLTEVNKRSGPHVYIRGSSKSKFDSIKDKMHSDSEVREFFDKRKTIELVGPRGYCFLADTFGLHKGLVPVDSPRLLLQVIYSLKQTPFGPKKPFLDDSELNMENVNLGATNLVNNNIIRKIH